MAQDKLLDVEIITPQKVIFSGKAESVTVPGSQSAFQVLFNHAPIVSTLDPGIVKIVTSENNKLYYAVQEGFAEVRNNKVSILVDSAFDASTIDINTVTEELKSVTEELSHAENLDVKSNLKSRIKNIQNKIKAYNKQKGIV
jgi:F-type H+-transporting ATPase subunit epsilon